MGSEHPCSFNDIIINCEVFVSPIIKYLNKKIGVKEIVNKEIQKLGLSLEFLSNKKNFVSYNYFSSLLALAEDLTGDKDFINIFEFKKKRFTFKLFIYYLFLISNIFSKEKIITLLVTRLLCKYYIKIRNLSIIKKNENEFELKFPFLSNDKINIIFCLFLESFFSFIGRMFYFNIELIDKHKCSFKIKFLNVFLLIKKIIYFTFILLMIFEIWFFKEFFFATVFLLTILFFSFLNSLINTYVYINFYSFNTLNSVYLIDRNYKELIKKEKEITERNLYLTILNEVRNLIYNALYFTPLLLNVAKIFLEKLDFLKAIYFEFNDKKKSYEYLFELNNFLLIEENAKNVSFSNIILLEGFKQEILKRDIEIPSYLIKEYIVDYNSKFDFSFLTNKKFYFLLIDIQGIYSGFFLFYKNKELESSKEFISILFNDVAELLKISYQNILNSHTVENILSSIPSYVVIFDINRFLIKFVNELFLTSFPFINKNEILENKVIGKDLFSVIPFNSEDINNIKHYVNYEINNYRSKRFETIIGNYFFEYHLFRIPNFKGQERFLGIVMNDITEAKYFWRNMIVNEKLIALGRVASGIAHEINNPLYAVLANAEEIAEDKNLGESIRRCAEDIITQVINVSNIIKDLSAFSKTLRKEEINFVDINNVIDESLKLVKYSSNYLEVEVIKELNPLPYIKATKGEIQQVFINIFTNAIQAMNGKGRLYVRSIYNKANKIKITISDTGCGINKKDLPYIFDLYFSTKREGSGLGLHIVKKIIEKYNGKIYVKSKLGEGTIFNIYFNIFKDEHKNEKEKNSSN